MKQQLAILRRQPAPYNVKEAVSEFQFISGTFLPIAQRSQLPEELVCVLIILSWHVYHSLDFSVEEGG